MAINIDNEANVAIVPGVNTEVVGTTAGRESSTIQVQAEGTVWVKLTGAASRNDGIRIGGWEILTISAQFARSQPPDFYEGPINVFWEPKGVDPATHEPWAGANCRLLEASG